MDKVKGIYRKYLHNCYGFCILWAVVLNLIIETLGRKETMGLGGILFMVQHPLPFLYNVMLVLCTLVIACLFRRRIFYICIVSSLWLTIGIVNGIILIQRMTPFTVKDLDSITDGATILTNYFSMKQIILAGIGIVLIIGLFLLIFFKAPKKQGKIKWKRNMAVVLMTIVATLGITTMFIRTGVLSTFFGNLAYAYRDYGVPYCFVNTWLNTGISKPEGYSKEAVDKILENAKIPMEDGEVVLGDDEDYKGEKPNIIFVQLESFVDPMLFKNIKLSEDPIPYYRSLMENYSSGDLIVPACGAGTANTEFESMTGLSVKFFGPGEYPFKSVLKDRASESMATALKEIGYGTHAIHNHRAMFYNRNLVFNNIGFDTFTSVEYMSDVAKTPKNWAKDSILISQIDDALNSTEGSDYIYTISVQGHGKYPSEQMIQSPAIQVTEAPNEETKWKYEYYVNQVHEMDQFVKNLVDDLSKREEKTVLILYGDHIPALDVTESSYDAKSLYTTQYVIWDNFGMKKENQSLTAYQIGAEVMDRLGMHEGTIFRYQQNTDWNSANYLPNLKMLGYDMLYGADYMYGEKNPIKQAGMKMGIKPIKITNVVNIAGKYYIKGENFTEYSKITLDGKTLKTVYLGSNLLGLKEEVNPDTASRMKVSQIDKSNNEIISSTE